MSFLELNKKIREWLKSVGYTETSLVQRLSIPKIIEGKDVLIIAPTGHGKTLAAILPIFHKMLKEESNGIRLLYITPLKSLNRDIVDRIIKIANHIGLEVDLRHGDTPQKIRAQQLADPADVLVTTPETLQAILTAKKFREHLRHVKYVVVDEIHELCESKRGSQLSVGLERLERLSSNFQRIGLSATIGDVKEIAKFLTSKECEIIDAREEKKYEIKIEYPKPSIEDILLSKKIGTTPSSAFNLRKIKELVEKSNSTIVFVNTRETAETLCSKIKKWLPDFPIAVHHSSLSKEVRIDVEKKFKDGEIKAIIATSSLELGIDIGSVDLVIQYGSPRQATKLIQRIGRSGHRIGGVSKGIILTNNVDDYLEALAIIKKIKDGWLEKPIIPKKPLDVLAHQIVGLCMDFQNDGITPTKEDVYNIVKKAYPFKELKFSEFDSVIEVLKEINLIGESKKGIFRTRKGLIYYFENISTIPTEKNFVVVSSDMNKKIGTLHQGFVAQHVKPGAKFIMRGEVWKVVEIVDDKIYVISSDDKEGAVPSWEGELIPVPMEIAMLAADLREEKKFSELDEQKRRFILPTSKKMYLESYENYVILHSCFGNKVNLTLGKAVGAIVSSAIGSSIGVRADPYRIIFKMPELFGQETIVEALKEINPDWIYDILLKSLKNSSLFEYRFYHVAKRFGIVGKDAEFSKSIISKIIDIYQKTPVVYETMNELLREKLDIENAKEILNKLKNGEIKIITSCGYEISPLGAEGLSYGNVSLIKPKGNVKEIYEMVKQRILKRKFWFACINCGNPIGIYSVKNLPENLKCPKCGARLIAFAPAKELEVIKKVVKKKFSKQELTNEEKKIFDKFSETAELFINYGKKAVFVLAGYGIGPTVGRRILARFHKTEGELIKDIVNAERSFIETRMFW